MPTKRKPSKSKKKHLPHLCENVITVLATTCMNDIQRVCHDNAKEKGWWDGKKHNIPEKLALVHSEISEALEEYRIAENKKKLVSVYYPFNAKPEGFVVELADAVIRVMDLCQYLGVSLAETIALKHAYNKTRTHRHGGKRA